MPFSNHYGLLLLPSFVALAVAKYCDEYVCLCVCLSARISPGPHSRSLPKFMCMLPVSVARSSSGMLTIGRIACRREGGDGSAQRGRSVIYDCVVFGSRPSGHYFRSVCLSVCLFVCAGFFSAVFDPISIKLGHMLYVWV